MVDFGPDTSPSTKRIDRYFYSMNDRLGQGAFGTVFLGHDIEKKDKLYAIKVIPVLLIKTDPALQESLMNEMQVMKLLNHPNIIHCFDVLSSSNNHYFILEYCSGGTLTSYLKKRGKIPEAEALTIITQILKGYHEMLKLGIIHRDLKPDNILMHEGVFKLADFGFAKCVENFNKDLMKSLVGTPLYMSPQILQQQEYSTKSDLWSIALIYYEMLFGKTPWDAKTQYELVNKILKQPPNFPPEVKISEESKSFILGALKLEETERLSWDEVFSHLLFNDCFDYKRRRTTLKEKALNYQGMLKAKIIEKNIDLYKLFSIIDKNNNNQLEMNEFAELMKKLDDGVSREQIEFIYNSIDENGDNSISLYEFRKWLTTQTPIQYQANNIQANPIQVNLNLGGGNLQRNQSLPMNNSQSPPKGQLNYPGTPMNLNNPAPNNSYNQNMASPNPNQKSNPCPYQANQIPNPMHNSNDMQGSKNFGQPSPGYMQGPSYIPPPQPYIPTQYNTSQAPQYNNNQPPYIPPTGYPVGGSPNNQPPQYIPQTGYTTGDTGYQMGGSTPYNPYTSATPNYMHSQQGGYGTQDVYPPVHSGFNQYNQGQFPQNQQGYNYIPMQMQGPNPNYNKNISDFITQIRYYLQKTNSNVERLFTSARGDRLDLDRSQFGWLIQSIKLPMSLTEPDLDMIFWEFDLDKDGKISLSEFKKLILNI